MRPIPRSALAVLGGLCLAAATPPWGFWPLAFVGIALLDHVLDGAHGIVRFGRAWIVWFALFLPSLFWMKDLTAPGYVIASFSYAGFLATGTVLAPKGPGRWFALPAGIILAEWVRFRWPFGGVPLSNIAIGQVAGPLAPMLRLGGALFVVGMTATVGTAIAAAWRRAWQPAAVLGVLILAVLGIAIAAPSGRPTGETLDVAVVQGGGPQGTRAATTEPGIVLERHLDASMDLVDGLDLVVWPEDVVDVTTLTGSPEERALIDIATEWETTFVAGVIEDETDDRFRNWAVVYGPEGDEVGRYEKVERVPFGEWVPFRGLLEQVAGDALPQRDAAIGQTPAVVDSPAGLLGISISWEIFFGERARDATNHGAEILLNPTNGASFSGTQVQTQQVANSRMRAIENGRWVLQAAPTGFSAVVTPDGDVLQRTSVSDTEILYDTVELRRGETVYVNVGDYLALAYAAVMLGLGWLIERRRWWPAESRAEVADSGTEVRTGS